MASVKNAVGSLSIAFESDIENLKEYMESANYGLCYISQKKGHFCTHGIEATGARFEALHNEVFCAMEEKWRGEKTEIEIKRAAFFVTKKILNGYDQAGDEKAQISYWVNKGAFNLLNSRKYAQMASAVSTEKLEMTDVVVSSIEIIKGLEAKRCLFILSSDLAPYLFKIKTDDNKMSHLLYVALTRLTDHLTILIPQDAEASFTRTFILTFFERYSVSLYTPQRFQKKKSKIDSESRQNRYEG